MANDVGMQRLVIKWGGFFPFEIKTSGYFYSISYLRKLD